MDELTEIYNKLYRYCFYKIRNSADAQDITQETLLRFFAQKAKIKHGGDMAYLYTIAKNLCVDFFRKKQTPEFCENFLAEGFSGTSDTKIAVRAALEKLSEERREVVLLRYLGGLSVGETAQTMGISRFAEHRLEKAALTEMKKYLKGAGQHED